MGIMKDKVCIVTAGAGRNSDIQLTEPFPIPDTAHTLPIY